MCSLPGMSDEMVAVAWRKIRDAYDSASDGEQFYEVAKAAKKVLGGSLDEIYDLIERANALGLIERR